MISELVQAKLIEYYNTCQRKIQNTPNRVYSDADFAERKHGDQLNIFDVIQPGLNFSEINTDKS